MADDHTPLFEIRAALDGPGCALCALVQRSVRRYLSALMFEGVTDRRQRDRIRSAYGFCSAHGRMLREGRDALGSAIIHRDIIANLSRALAEERAAPHSHTARLRRVFRPATGGQHGPLPSYALCPACERSRESEQRYTAVLADALADQATLERFRSSSGLCLPHLRHALRIAPAHTHDLLRAAQIAVWERLIVELDEFIRKQDHRFRHEPSGTEADSWRRAIDLVSGTPEAG